MGGEAGIGCGAAHIRQRDRGLQVVGEGGLEARRLAAGGGGGGRGRHLVDGRALQVAQRLQQAHALELHRVRELLARGGLALAALFGFDGLDHVRDQLFDFLVVCQLVTA